MALSIVCAMALGACAVAAQDTTSHSVQFVTVQPDVNVEVVDFWRTLNRRRKGDRAAGGARGHRARVRRVRADTRKDTSRLRRYTARLWRVECASQWIRSRSSRRDGRAGRDGRTETHQANPGRPFTRWRRAQLDRISTSREGFGLDLSRCRDMDTLTRPPEQNRCHLRRREPLRQWSKRSYPERMTIRHDSSTSSCDLRCTPSAAGVGVCRSERSAESDKMTLAQASAFEKGLPSARVVRCG